MILPKQPWLDGYYPAKGLVRQFVAIPLGHGYTTEEQLTGRAEFGGIQLQICPLKAHVYFKEEVLPRFPKTFADLLPEEPGDPGVTHGSAVKPTYSSAIKDPYDDVLMGLAPGGRIKQQIFEGPRPLESWDQSKKLRCFVHLCNSVMWKQITNHNPRHPPFTAQDYNRHGLPWFDYYREDLKAVSGPSVLQGVKSVKQFGQQQGDDFLLHNQSFTPQNVVKVTGKVREWNDEEKGATAVPEAAPNQAPSPKKTSHNTYLISDQGKQSGPFTKLQITKMWENGRITALAFVLVDDKWKSVSTYFNLK